MRLIFLIATLLILGAVWFLLDLNQQTIESMDWCTTAGGVPLTERGHFLVCLKADAVIERVE